MCDITWKILFSLSTGKLGTKDHNWRPCSYVASGIVNMLTTDASTGQNAKCSEFPKTVKSSWVESSRVVRAITPPDAVWSLLRRDSVKQFSWDKSRRSVLSPLKAGLHAQPVWPTFLAHSELKMESVAMWFWKNLAYPSPSLSPHSSPFPFLRLPPTFPVGKRP